MSIFIIVKKQGAGNSYGIAHSLGYTTHSAAEKDAKTMSEFYPGATYYVAELKKEVVSYTTTTTTIKEV